MRKFIPSNQTRGYRQVAQYPVTADNSQFLVDIPRGPHIESLQIKVAGTITNSVAFAGGVRNLAAYYMLRSAQWVINSNVTMDSVSGPQARQLMFTRRNLPVELAPSAAAAVTTFNMTVVLDRALMDMMRPKDSLLKTDVGMSNNQLRLQLGALADMFQPGAGASAYTSVQLTVSITDYQEARDDKGQTPQPLWYPKRNGQLQSLASGNQQQVKLNTGNRLRAVSFRILDPTTREPLTTALNRLRIKRAGDTRVDLDADALADYQQCNYGSDLMPGQYLIDFADNGALGVRYSEFWPIPSSADTYLEVDTGAPCFLELATLEGVDLVAA
jgi:hypothetical protein